MPFHVFVVGQSNALAGETADPQWDAEIPPLGNVNPRAFIADPYGALFPSSCYAWPWTDTNPGQGLQRTIADALQRGIGGDVSVSTHAQGGAPYASLKKGSLVYNNSLTAFRKIVEKRTMTGTTPPFVAMHIDHGESNGADSAATYAGYLSEWLADYTTDVQAITGQTKKLMAVMAACGSVTGPGVAVIDTHRTNPRFICAGPKYHLPKGTATHITALGHYRNGEYHAKALAYTMANGRRWEPLHPIEITRNGNIVTVRFNVPVGQLAFDPSEAAPRTAANPAGETKPLYATRGFAFTDSSSSATVSSVAITGPATVTITLSANPTGTNQRIVYIDGNLHDGDTTPSAADGRPLWNWCVPFSDPIGFAYTPLALPDDVKHTIAPLGVQEWDGTAWKSASLEMWDGGAWVPVVA